MSEENQDFVSHLGYLSMAAQMKRLSDHMMHSARQLYKVAGIDIEPNWDLVFLLLKEHRCLSITEISEHLQFSHPSVISLVRKMSDKGYLRCAADPKDSRRQLVKLSAKALGKLPEYEAIWQAGERSIQALFEEGDDFLDQLDRLQALYREQDFKTRTQNELRHV